jgi:hypothetical protein
MPTIESVSFPSGIVGAKTRYLEFGLSRIGVKTQYPSRYENIAVVPIDVRYSATRVVRVYLDISVKKSTIDKTIADGRNIYFKTHYNTDLFSEKQRIFHLPQSLGNVGFVDQVPILRRKRERRGAFYQDVFGLFAYNDQRAAAVDIVKKMGITSLVGINKVRPVVVVDRRPLCARISNDRFIAEMSRSALALSFPSYRGFAGGGPWCSFRHVEAWAVGTPVVTIKPRAYAVIGNPEPFWFETKDDLSDLSDVIRAALADERTRKEFSARSIAYFDEYHHPESVARYFLRTIERALDGPD